MKQQIRAVTLCVVCILLLIVFVGCSHPPSDDILVNTNTNDSQPRVRKTIHHDNILYADNKNAVSKVVHIDVNQDGITDTLEYSVAAPRASMRDVELKINDAALQRRLENPASELQIIDINPFDQYLEIDIFDEGPSDDPISMLYIYNGTDIIEIGKIPSRNYTLYDNQQIVDDSSVYYFAPEITLGYYTLDNEHKIIYVPHDKTVYVNNEYTLITPHPLFDYWRLYDSYKAEVYSDLHIYEIKEGDTVTVIDAVIDSGAYFKVRTADGTEGWLIPFIFD